MIKKLKPMLLAALVAASAGAHAGIAGGVEQPNSSALFMVYDRTGDAISFTADLGYSYSDFTSGVLTNPGTRIEWNFANDTARISTNNGTTWTAVAGSFSYSTAYSTFTGLAEVADLRWGALAYDDLDNTDGTGRGLLVTGTPTKANMDAVTAARLNNGIGALRNFSVASQQLGSHNTVDNGANTATSGTAYVPTGVNTHVGNTTNIWNIMLANGATSRLQYLSSAANPVVTQLGLSNVVDNTIASLDDATTFQFDMTTNTLTFATPVPEPGTYALMAAGLLAVGALARRRKV